MNIKIARIKRGLTQEALCKKVGMSRTSLVKVEKGDFTPLSYKTIMKLLEVLNEPFEKLFFCEVG